MKVDLHIMIIINPQVGSSIRSSICFSITKNDGKNVATLYLEELDNASCLIPEGLYSGRVDFSATWVTPIIRIDAHGITQSILYR